MQYKLTLTASRFPDKMARFKGVRPPLSITHTDSIASSASSFWSSAGLPSPASSNNLQSEKSRGSHSVQKEVVDFLQKVTTGSKAEEAATLSFQIIVGARFEILVIEARSQKQSQHSIKSEWSRLTWATNGSPGVRASQKAAHGIRLCHLKWCPSHHVNGVCICATPVHGL